jgi:hypothetical protein
MRNKALVFALFAAGLAASFAVGSSAGVLEGTTGSTRATTTGTTTGEPDHGKKDRSCRNVSLHGTAGASSFTLAVDKSNEAGKSLGPSVSLSFSGRVSVKARLCGTGAAATLQLRELKVAEHQSEQD